MARRDDRRGDRDDRPGPAGSNGPSLFLVLTIVVAIIAGSFVIQNREEATIQYLLFFESELQIWVAIAAAMALGVLLDRLFILWRRRAKRDDE